MRRPSPFIAVFGSVQKVMTSCDKQFDKSVMTTDTLALGE